MALKRKNDHEVQMSFYISVEKLVTEIHSHFS